MFSDRGTERVVDQISLGALKLKPEADLEVVKAKLLKQLPGDFIVSTKSQMTQREKAHTIKKSPVGIIFGIGLIVGFIICYQILFNEIQDHLAQFATLKAIGHHQAYVFGIVVSEALLLSVVGFLPGLLFSWGLYQMIERFTQIIMFMTPMRMVLIFALTTSMCLFSATLAAYKVIRADPADLY